MLGFTFLWDDYDFLTNALTYRLDDLFPDPSDPFYRPISRGIYYLLIHLAGEHGPVLGHILNLSFLAGVVFLLAWFVSRLAGQRAGLISGVVYAGIGAVPLLVGWICCDQDLIAMLLVLVAFHLRLSGRWVAALVATAAALLSKETTLAVVPALVLFDWILGRRPHRIGRDVAVYGALIAAWAAIHPAMRTLISRGLRSGATGYVGLEEPARWPVFFGRYLLTILNLPAYKSLPSWSVGATVMLLVALALVAAGFWKLRKDEEENPSLITPLPKSRMLMLGALLALGPMVLSSIAIRAWAPYYVGFPGLGFAILLACLLTPLRRRWQVLFIALYLALGIWVRGTTADPRNPTEPNMRMTSQALKQVEASFRHLYPHTMPQGAQVLLSVQAHGPGGIYAHMYLFQALRVWYNDRAIYTLRPEARRPSDRPDLLMVIAPDRGLIEISTASLSARTASGRNPDYDVCETAVRAYAMGLAGSGEIGNAVDVLLRMPEVSVGLASVHRRMAAMFLLSEGRNREAEAILDSTAVLPRGVAIADLRAVLAEQPEGRIFDEHALRAFAISPDDTTAIRDLMLWFAKMKYMKPALRFAARLSRIVPHDQEAKKVAQDMTAALEAERAMPPAPNAIE